MYTGDFCNEIILDKKKRRKIWSMTTFVKVVCMNFNDI